MPQFKKGSKAAKDYMAKIRSMKGKPGRKAKLKVYAKPTASGKIKPYVKKIGSNKTFAKNEKAVLIESDPNLDYDVYAIYVNGEYDRREKRKKSKKSFVNKTSKTKKIGGYGYGTYLKAPADVKKIIDALDFMEDYGKLEKAKKALAKKGYYMDYGLDGTITEFRKMPSKKSSVKKKVGAAKKMTKAQLTKLASDYAYATSSDYDRAVWNILDPDYTDILIPKYKAAIEAWEKKNYPYKISGVKKPSTKNKNAKMTNPAFVKWLQFDNVIKLGNGKYSTKDSGYTNSLTKAQAYEYFKKQYGINGVSKHKDTNSHNVNIKVMSGINNTNDDVLKRMQQTSMEIAAKQEYMEGLKKRIPTMEKEDRIKYRRVVDFYNTWIKELKAHLRELKKLVK